MRYSIIMLQVILINLPLIVQSQSLVGEQKVDSMLTACNRNSKEDIQKLEKLNFIAYSYRNISPSKGFIVVAQAIALSKKIKNLKGYAAALNNKAILYLVRREPNKADSAVSEAIKINEKNNDQKPLADNYLVLARISGLNQKFKQELEYYQKAYHTYEKLNYKVGMAEALRGIGVSQSNNGQTQEGINYALQSLQLAENINNQIVVAEALNSLGSLYKTVDNKKAIANLQKAIVINSELGINTGLVSNYLNLGTLYSKLGDKNALTIFEKGIALDKYMGNKNGEGLFDDEFARFYLNTGDYFKAIEYYQISQKIYVETGNRNGEAISIANIGLVHHNLGDEAKYFEYTQKNLKMQEELGNKLNVATALANLAVFYGTTEDYKKSIEYETNAAKIFEELNDQDGMAHCYANLGGSYSSLSEFDKSYFYLNKALHIYEKTLNSNKEQAYVYNKIGYTDALQYNYVKAYRSITKAINLYDSNANKRGLAHALVNLSGVINAATDSEMTVLGFTSTAGYAKALELELRALKIAEEIGEVFRQQRCWENMSDTYEKQKDFAKSYVAYKNYIKLRDSSNSTEKQKEITRLQMQYDFDNKEVKYKYEKQLSDEKMLLQKREIGMQQQALTLSNKEKDLQHLEYLKTQAELNQQKIEGEKQLAINEKKDGELKLIGKEKDLQKAALELTESELAAKEYQRNGFIIGLLILIGLSFLIYRNYSKQLKANKALDKSNQILKETQQQLVQQEKLASLGQLTAGIAHEIQNPLNFVTNFSKLSNELLDELLSAETETERAELYNDLKSNLQKINHHGKRADGIVKGMLEHSRKSVSEKQETNINVLINELSTLAWQNAKINFPNLNCKINTQLDDSIPHLLIQRQEISSVILNIITNALYAIKEKKDAELFIESKLINSHIVLKIRDNGTGIPEHIKQKIFEPFFTTKPTNEGTGLGLSLSYDIIKSMGGNLKVESKENEFTEFTISIPV